MASSWQRKETEGTPQKTIIDVDYADDIVLLANTPNQAETLLLILERAAVGIGLHVNAHKTKYMCYNQTGDISTLDGTSLKLVNKFTYQGSSVSSTEKDIDTRLKYARTAIERLSIIWKLDLTDKMKRSFFQAPVVSIQLYGCTTWTLTKRPRKKLDGNYTRMLRAVLNKSWQQHPTRYQLYGHLPPITKTIQVRRSRHAGHCWRSKGEVISDVLLWTRDIIIVIWVSTKGILSHVNIAFGQIQILNSLYRLFWNILHYVVNWKRSTGLFVYMTPSQDWEIVNFGLKREKYFISSFIDYNQIYEIIITYIWKTQPKRGIISCGFSSIPV